MSAHSSAVVLDDRQRGVEIVATATRRRFTAEYKLRVLREADACTEPGEIGALRRRESPSHLCLWRKQRGARELMGLAPARGGPAPKATNPLAAKVAAWEKEMRWLNAPKPWSNSKKKSQRSWGSNSSSTESRTDGGGGATADGGRDRPGVRGPLRGACELLPTAAPKRRGAPAPAIRPPGPPIRRADEVLALLTDDRFADRAPAQVYAALLDEGTFRCSISTMDRILRESRLVRDRRNPRRHPSYHKPDLRATGPHEVWSWDSTKLLGPVKWTDFHLSVILDIFSRYVTGGMVAPRESAALAPRLIAETGARQGIGPGQVFLQADRGRPLTSKPVARLMADLGVTRSHSRPQVSHDTPCLLPGGSSPGTTASLATRESG